MRARWGQVATRADLARSTGLRHAWRRARLDASFAQDLDRRRLALSKNVWREGAEAIGARVVDISAVFTEIHRNGSHTVVMGQTTPLNDAVAVELAEEKDLVHSLHVKAGLPVPSHVLVAARDDREAEAFLESSSPCVVKPSRGSGGEGVTGEVRQRAQLRRAVRHAGAYGGQVLVEQQMSGDLYRVLVLDGEILGGVRRRRPRVHGDGSSTIEDLIFAEYDRRLVRDGEPLKPFVADLDCLFTLAAQNLSLESVPSAGVAVEIKTVSSQNRPEDNETVPANAFDRVRDETAAAAATLGLRLAGVDIVTPTLERSLASEGGAILEVNARPALHHHRNVRDRANATPVAARVLETLLAE